MRMQGTLLSRTDAVRTRGPRHRWITLFASGVLSLFAQAASGYVEDVELERQLNASEANGLARLPALRFGDGVAGFFRTHDLYVVPETGRAWCQDRMRGVLAPGCYVEFFFQMKGYRPHAAGGLPCGLIGRWHRAPGSNVYAPTPGATHASAMAAGDWQAVLTALATSPDPVRFRDVQRREDCATRW
jgi:hypothetical protein